MDLSLASFAVGIIGILLAVYQGFEKRKLSKYLRSQSWYIYSMSLFSWASAQKALVKYKEIAGDKLHPDIFESLSKCDALSLSLSLEAIRQIQLSEPRFDLQTITTWSMQGKIPKDQVQLFMRILSLEPHGTLCLLWKTFENNIVMKLQKKYMRQQPKPPESQDDAKPKEDV